MWSKVRVLRDRLPRRRAPLRAFFAFSSRPALIAVLLSVAAVLAARAVAAFVFEDMSHLEDEMAYVWQAQVFAGGEIRLPSPPAPRSILVPFVVDHDGWRFGKYPPGWPLVLSFGLRLGARAWVNPLLAGLGLWLLFRLGRKLFDAPTGLIAAGLTLTSPFFLLNSGSLLSHAWSLVLSLAFTLAWLDLFCVPSSKRMTALLVPVAGLSLGLMALTRPLSAIGMALPFFLHGLWLIVRGDGQARVRVLLVGLLAATVAALLPVWQAALTGDPSLNPYTLWWPYDRVGFGEGFGRMPGGHTLRYAFDNLYLGLYSGAGDLFGWGRVSWLFLPFGAWAARRDRRMLLLTGVFLSLLLVYMAYWVGSSLFGPRYYYEAIPVLALLSAAGIAWLWRRARGLSRGRLLSAGVALLAAALVAFNLAVYLPGRCAAMRGLYGIDRSDLAPFLTEEARSLTPALVVVHVEKEWTEYGALLELQDARLTTPFIFAYTRGTEQDAALSRLYPERSVIHYYTGEPGIFRPSPR